MKTLLYIGTGLTAVLVIVFLSLAKSNGNQIAEQSTRISQQTPLLSTHTPSSPTSTPTPTLSPREQIVAEARQLVAEYDQAVKTELQKGEVEISKDPTSGKEIFRFKGDSYETIAKLYDVLNQQLQTLNKQSMAL